jgi:hypothetical protein
MVSASSTTAPASATAPSSGLKRKIEG